MPPVTLNFAFGPVETFFLIATRLLAALATSPVISTSGVPTPTKIGLGVFSALVLAPVVGHDPASAAVELSWSTVASEILVGTIAGFAATVVYTAVQFGAGLLDIQAGFALASVYDPTFGDSSAQIERFYRVFAALLFLETGAHHLLLQGMRELFVVVPLGTFNLTSLRLESVPDLLTGMFRVSLQLVLPVVAALLLADMALAILARVAPQFNIFAVGVPLKAGVAMGAILVTLPVLLPRLHFLFNTVASVFVAIAK